MILLAWLYLWQMAVEMDAVLAPAPVAANPFAPAALAFTFLMWVVMMAGMMLPSAAPTLLLYATLVRKNGERGTVLPGLWTFAVGYLAVWTGYSAAATLLQAGLESAALLTPAMTSASTMLSALVLIAAGVFQLTPLKRACLGKCRNPMEFFVTRWRAGPSGAIRMGVEHGMYCVGCCWALMLLLFVAGVMNLIWVAAITAFVFVEKLLPAAPMVSRLTSVALIVAGLYLLVAR